MMSVLTQFADLRMAVFVISVCIGMSSGCRNSGDKLEAVGQAAATNPAQPNSYSTRFPRTENPISETGNWVGGSGAGTSLWEGGHFWRGGRLWGDVQTTSGFAYGIDEPTEYGDPTAILKGAWGPTQTVMATVKIKKTPRVHCCHEVELRLRTTISLFRITGYEAYCSVVPEHPYCHIARWNGPNGSYWNFETESKATYVVDGDVMKATATGTNPTVITLYKNDEQIAKGVDTGAAGGGFGAFGPWTHGNPGIGFFDNYDSKWGDFGFSSFSATDAGFSPTHAVEEVPR